MANLPETSFMPQQPLLRVEGGTRRKEPINLALVVALIIFFVTLSVSGGMYFYKTKLAEEVAQKSQELADQEKKLNIDEITAFKNLQTTLSTAKRLVDSHTIFSVLLDMVEAHAAENVGLTAFDYKKDDTDVKVSVSGQAPSYAAVYFQVEEWRHTPYVKKVEVSALALDVRTSVVAFSAQVDIDPSYVNFTRVLQDQAAKAAKAESESVTLPVDSLLTPPLPTSASGTTSALRSLPVTPTKPKS